MKYEVYKLYVKKKAWLILLIFMAIRMFTAVTQPNPAVDYRMELYRDSYMSYMDILEGPLSDEKAAYIAEMNMKINDLSDPENDTDISDYTSGLISEEEFNERYRARRSGRNLRDEFAVINDRFAAVQADPEHVYFMYTNGWTCLIGIDRFDFVLLILLMILIVPMICDEFKTEMYPILRTTPYGGTRLYTAKSAVAAVTACVSAILMFTIEAVYYAFALGLPDGHFPVQSLPPFADSPYQISIFGAALLTLLNRCFGAIFFSAILVCFSVIFRRALSVFSIGTAVMLLPYITLSTSKMKYVSPLPLGFILSSGFLKMRSPISPLSQEFITVTPLEYLRTLLLSVIVIAILFVIGMLVYSENSIRLRKINLALALCIICIALTGCKAQESAFELSDFVYDSHLYQPKNAEFEVTFDEKYIAVIRYLDTGETVPIVTDCFADDSFFQAKISYIDGNTVYFLNQYQISHYAIMALDTRDFSVKTVQESFWSDNVDRPEMLFGLGAYLPSARPQDESVSAFFVHDGQLIVSKAAGIIRYDLQTGEEYCICNERAENLAASCGMIYYLDGQLDLYQYDPKINRANKLPVGKILYFYATENGLICKDLKDNQFYFVSLNGGEKSLLPDFNEAAFCEEAKS